MSGQTQKSKGQIVEEYIKRVKPYEKPQPIDFDLRGYAAFMKANGLKGADVTPEMMDRFMIKKRV